MAVLGSTSLTVLIVPVDVIVKQPLKKKMRGSSELGGRSCAVKVGSVGVAESSLGSPFLTMLIVSVDVIGFKLRKLSFV